jgi:uncharacterized protein YPO0396
VEALDILTPRIDKMDNVIERLAEISSEIKQMLAVHEQRLSQHDKNNDYIEDLIEQRRRDLDDKIDMVYNTMRSQDNGILDEIKKLREESTAQHSKLTERINQLEKFIWLAIGGGITLTWIISYAANYFKILGH